MWTSTSPEPRRRGNETKSGFVSSFMKLGESVPFLTEIRSWSSTPEKVNTKVVTAWLHRTFTPTGRRRGFSSTSVTTPKSAVTNTFKLTGMSRKIITYECKFPKSWVPCRAAPGVLVSLEGLNWFVFFERWIVTKRSNEWLSQKLLN